MRTKRQPVRQSIWENRFGYLPAALSVGIGLLLAGLAALSGLLLLSDLSERISALLLGLLLFCFGYSMGRFAGFHRRRKGWLTGLCCGLLLCGILLAVGLFWQGTAGSPVRLLLICGGSIWGGISGVNAPTRSHRNNGNCQYRKRQSGELPRKM